MKFIKENKVSVIFTICLLISSAAIIYFKLRTFFVLLPIFAISYIVFLTFQTVSSIKNPLKSNIKNEKE